MPDCVLSLCGNVGHVLEDGSLCHSDDCVLGNLYVDSAFCQVYALHGAVDAAAYYHLHAFGQLVLEVTDSFLLLLLRTNHEEIHDGKDGHHHQQHHHAATALLGL